jgi:hypothetical protein
MQSLELLFVSPGGGIADLAKPAQIIVIIDKVI